MNPSEILASWTENAHNWIDIIWQQGIASRAVTSPAIVQTVQQLRPAKVLDLGCGEGWLTRKLNSLNIETVGVDGTPALTDWASKQSQDRFQCISFEQITRGAGINPGPFEAVVLNFCLYEDESTENLLRVIQNHLFGRKLIIIQTLHPLGMITEENFVYRNQWLEDSWKGLKGSFSSPHQWYYRTLGGWFATFERCGLLLRGIQEPKAPDSRKPSSIIFTLTSDHADQL